jgi:DNA-binding LacI/PurR family transcriptional regulator
VINDLRNPFFTEFATSVQMAHLARGYATVIGNTDEDPQIQALVVGSMVGGGVSALVTSRIYDDADAALSWSQGTRLQPCVLQGRSTRAFGQEAALKLIRDHLHFDAALCFNDLVALGMMSGFAAQRWQAAETLLIWLEDGVHSPSEICAPVELVAWASSFGTPA